MLVVEEGAFKAMRCTLQSPFSKRDVNKTHGTSVCHNALSLVGVEQSSVVADPTGVKAYEALRIM